MHIERDDTPQQEDGKQPCTPVSRFTPLIVTAKDATDASQCQQQQQQQHQETSALLQALKRKPTGEEAIIVAAEKKAKREAVKAAAKRAKVHEVEDGPAPALVANGGDGKGALQNAIDGTAHKAGSSSPGLLGLLDGLGSKSPGMSIKPAPSSAKPAAVEGHGREIPARGLTSGGSYAVPASTSAHGATGCSAARAEAAAVAEESGRNSKKKEEEEKVTHGAHTSGYPGPSTSPPPTIEDARFSLRIVRGILTTFNEIEDKAAAQGVSFIKAAPCEEWLEIHIAYVEEEVLKRFGGEVAERNEVFKHLSVVAELALQALRGVREGEG